MKKFLSPKIIFLSSYLLVWTSIQGFSGNGEDVRVLKKHNAPVKAVALQADGKVAASGGEDKVIYLWDLSTGEIKGSINTYHTIRGLEFTPEGNLIVAAGNTLRLMETSGRVLKDFQGYTTDIWSFSYCRPVQRITAGSYARYIKVWDVISGKMIQSLEGHEKSCLPVCYSPDGKLIASGSLDKSVRIWNTENGSEIHKLELHSENIFAVDFHPSGKYLISSSADKTLRLWNAETGKIVRTFVGHQAAIMDARFSPDGNHLLSCDAANTIILWETATGKKLHTFDGHTACINAVRFNKDGSSFISASDDQTVRHWLLSKKYYLEGSYFEKEIEKEVQGMPLFLPRGAGESKQDYAIREEEANKTMNTLYEKYYGDYLEMLNKLPIE